MRQRKVWAAPGLRMMIFVDKDHLPCGILAAPKCGNGGQGMLLALVFALAAALANAVNLMTLHKASVSAPRQVKGWRLALYLPRQPLWLLGVAAAVGSFVFQALALRNGPMSVVQPLLRTL